MCTLLPNPGIFDDELPLVFPTNWPDESFYFTGDATIVAGGVDLTYVSAVEAAFGGGVPAAGDQVTFARIRIRARRDGARGPTRSPTPTEPRPFRSPH